MGDKQKKKLKLDKLKRKHRFFLNPYQDVRFTKCPQCGDKTRIRKHPFGIHIDPKVLLTLNMSGPYCPNCDLIILHQDTVESLLVMTFEQRQPEIIGNDYLIMGTVDRSYWRKTSKMGSTHQEFFDNLYIFEEVVHFEPMPYNWLPNSNETED